MNLTELSDDQLRDNARKLARALGKGECLLLHYIIIITKKRLVSDWHHASVFAWCRDELKLCNGSISLRLSSARVLEEFPWVEQRMNDGLLNISLLALVEKYFRENKIKKKNEKQCLINSVIGLTYEQAEMLLLKKSGKKASGKESQKRISEDCTQVTWHLDNEAMGILQDVKDLLGKKVSSSEMIKLMGRAYIEKAEKQKYKTTDKPKQAREANPGKRNFSASIVRSRFHEIGRKCEKCGSTFNIQKDHKHPFALGGKSSAGNIRLLCFNCNQREAIKMGLIPLHTSEVDTT